MDRERLNKEIESTLEQNRAAIAKARNYGRGLELRAVLSVLTMDRIFKEVREGSRRRY